MVFERYVGNHKVANIHSSINGLLQHPTLDRRLSDGQESLLPSDTPAYPHSGSGRKTAGLPLVGKVRAGDLLLHQQLFLFHSSDYADHGCTRNLVGQVIVLDT